MRECALTNTTTRMHRNVYTNTKGAEIRLKLPVQSMPPDLNRFMSATTAAVIDTKIKGTPRYVRAMANKKLQ